jgi:formylglycine-generating enzyme required for sulfatase activity
MNPNEPPACCIPVQSREMAGEAAPATRPATSRPPGEDHGARFVAITGGPFLMGANDAAAHPADGEGPARVVTLRPFRIDAVAVSNRRFARFVDDTGYQTEAERYDWSFVFQGFVSDTHPPTRAVASTPWWRQVHSANWRRPEGPGSSISDRLDHPVIHVTHTDAMAFCDWAGCRLPTEAEWECAARGGLVQKRYPWGGDLMPGGQHQCNIWQGRFPEVNTAEDGFSATAPVNTFEPNPFGLYNMVGNTWEWCSDWFHASYHATATLEDPQGPPVGSARVMRGGSYLCHESYCFRYRVSARSCATPDTSIGHVGFRVACDA